MNLLSAIERRMVDDWRNAMKWATVWIAGSASALFSAIAVGLSMSAAATQWASIIPLWAVFLLAGVIFALVVVGRLWRQPKAHEPDDNAEHA